MVTPSATPAANSEKDELHAQTHLTRTIEAALKVAVPDHEELRFRSSLLACAESKLQTLKPSFITRLYEAACDVKFPSDEVTAFRKALQIRIGRSFGLKQFRR
jgi:N-acetylglucosamine kinase-like BadF-type ATPase